jgi:DNA uptake protein ComE-like DNA-binding protein
LSGTLALELWALPHRYEGGGFEGFALASVTLGSLAGGARWQGGSYDLALLVPPAGTYYLVLMLREWNGSGYVTRDFSNFSQTVTFPLVFADIDADVELRQVSADDKVAGALQRKQAEALGASSAASAAQASKPQPAVKSRARSASRKGKAKSTAVAINEASEAELAGVSGLNASLAKRIARQRPFQELNDLLAVKGIGKRLLERLRDQVRL